MLAFCYGRPSIFKQGAQVSSQIRLQAAIILIEQNVVHCRRSTTYHEHLFVLQVELLDVMNASFHWVFEI